jgi:hypothetical protein
MQIQFPKAKIPETTAVAPSSPKLEKFEWGEDCDDRDSYTPGETAPDWSDKNLSQRLKNLVNSGPKNHFNSGSVDQRNYSFGSRTSRIA